MWGKRVLKLFYDNDFQCYMKQNFNRNSAWNRGCKIVLNSSFCFLSSELQPRSSFIRSSDFRRAHEFLKVSRMKPNQWILSHFCLLSHATILKCPGHFFFFFWVIFWLFVYMLILLICESKTLQVSFQVFYLGKGRLPTLDIILFFYHESKNKTFNLLTGLYTFGNPADRFF